MINWISVCLVYFIVLPIESQAVDNRPIIGILSQHPYNDANYSYIAASYIKYIESAGGRVVPILCNSTKDEITELFGSINGVLFPGGGASLVSSFYFNTGKVLYSLIVQAYNRGEYVPLWGTCLGMQMLCTIQHGSNDILSSFDSEDYTIPLNLTSTGKNFTSNRLFRFFNSTTLEWLTTEPLTMNEHHFGVGPIRFTQDTKLNSMFKILSTNLDRNRKEFVSTIEAYDVPIYGVQWHPEKNIFEWDPQLAMKHSYHAVRVSQTTANFLVEESRKNNHRFPNEADEKHALIYNYNPIYTSKDKDTYFEQEYRFPCC